MNYVIAIDPGTKKSGVVLLNQEDYRPLESAKLYNTIIHYSCLQWLKKYSIQPYQVEVVIEMIQGRFSQGFGSELLETAVWIGRFEERFLASAIVPTRIYRMDEYNALCANLYPRNDKGVQAALVDRFAYGQPHYGKGTKKSPGWFFGFSADIWQAYAVGVTYVDKCKGGSSGMVQT